jgi:hypothetical protein
LRIFSRQAANRITGEREREWPKLRTLECVAIFPFRPGR